MFAEQMGDVRICYNALLIPYYLKNILDQARFGVKAAHIFVLFSSVKIIEDKPTKAGCGIHRRSC